MVSSSIIGIITNTVQRCCCRCTKISIGHNKNFRTITTTKSYQTTTTTIIKSSQKSFKEHHNNYIICYVRSSLIHYDWITLVHNKKCSRTFSTSSSSRRRSGGGNNNNNNGNNSNSSTRDAFQNTYGLPYTVAPEHAIKKFYYWARTEQGLNTFLLNDTNVTIGATYCPVYSFTINVRYIVTDPNTGLKKFNWKPNIFSIYGKQSVIHIPGISAYAGYTYRRTLIDPIHNTTLIFLSEQIVPFSSWMLRDMYVNGNKLPIYPDPWNTTSGRAFTIVKELLVNLPGTVQTDDDEQYYDNIRVQTEILSTRRVYMPTYVINYKVLGMEYQAFISGCDDSAPVSGISHKVFDINNQDINNQATSFLSSAASVAQSSARIIGGRNLGTLIVVTIQFLSSLAARLLLRLPIIGALGSVFVGFRKIIRPWMDNRAASAEWERQREHEATMNDTFDHIDDFVDSGTAQQFFRANRGRILKHLSGEAEHEHGDYDWYTQWEEWARRQWEQQQRTYYEESRRYGQDTYQQQQQQYQRQQKTYKKSSQQEYQWDFDPNDPYSVLGVHRDATASEVSAAFRKNMMLHHPDTKTNASEAEKARAIERSKLITNAYQKIKTDMKRKKRM